MAFPRLTWRQKAAVQNAVARLPAPIGDPIYYALQRTVGGMRHVDPEDRLRAGVQIHDRLVAHGGSLQGATVVEVGTGWRLNVPLALWLLGTACVISVDLHRYLKPGLVRKDLATIRAAPERIRAMFGRHAATDTFQRRFEQLLAFRGSTAQLMRLTGVEYRAPFDAARLPVANGTADAHVSFTVLEHMPADNVGPTLREARRVLRPGGLLVHHVDFSDHSAHSDSSISAVNFLQYDDATWERLAGNRYAFHNRLRVDEFVKIVADAGVTTIALDTVSDPRAIAALEAGLPLAARFQPKPPAVNGVTHAWLVGR